MFRVFLTLCFLFTLSCATPNNLEDLGKFVILRGKIAGEPIFEDGGKRMFIYLEVESEVEEKKEVFICLAVNKEKKTALVDIKNRLMAAVDEPVFIYAYPNDERYEEIIRGIDYHIVAVGFYLPLADEYQYRLVNFSQGTREALKNISWGRFIKKLGKAVINKAF